MAEGAETQFPNTLKNDYYSRILSRLVNCQVEDVKVNKISRYKWKSDVTYTKDGKEGEISLMIKKFPDNEKNSFYPAYKSDMYESDMIKFLSRPPLNGPVPAIYDNIIFDKALLMEHIPGVTLSEKVNDETDKTEYVKYIDASIKSYAELQNKATANKSLLNQNNKSLIFIPDGDYFESKFIEYVKEISTKKELPGKLEKELKKEFSSLKNILTGDEFVHGDLHPKNIIIQNGKGVKVTFLDFADSYIGNGLADIASMLYYPSFDLKNDEINNYLNVYYDSKYEGQTVPEKKNFDFINKFKQIAFFRTLRSAAGIMSYKDSDPIAYSHDMENNPQHIDNNWFLNKALSMNESSLEGLQARIKETLPKEIIDNLQNHQQKISEQKET